MGATSGPTPASVVRLLDGVVLTGWPASTAECSSWGPLGLEVGEPVGLPPGHDDLLMQEVVTRLDGTVDGSLLSTPDGRPRNLGFFLYSSETDQADQEIGVAFEEVAAAMTDRWGSDVVPDRSPGARVWAVNGRIVELYGHRRPRHPRSGHPVGPACLQVGVGPEEPRPAR